MKELFRALPCLKGPRIVLERLEDRHAGALAELARSERVYRYLPTFLFEQKYPDAREVIRKLYDEALEESLILGVFDRGGAFCGLAEMYGWRAPIHKISVGYRLLERCWGRGIASEALGLMVRFLCEEAGIEIITASTMTENRASANVLRKNGFELVVSGALEDWGFPEPTVTDKWIS